MKTLQDLGQAVRQARETRRLTLAELAAATGISKPYLSNIENATMVGPPSADKLSRLAEALGMDEALLLQAGDWLRTPESIRQLLTGVTANAPRRTDGTVNLDALLHIPLVQKPVIPHEVKSSEDALRLIPVPVINKIPAGKPTEYTDLEYPPGVADHYVAGVASHDQTIDAIIALRVTGDSMEPEYQEGDIVQFANAPAQDGDDCLIRLGELDNFAQTFKRINFITQLDSSGKPQPVAAQLIPLNGKYPVREIRIEEISGIFPAIWKMTPTKRTPAKLPKT